MIVVETKKRTAYKTISWRAVAILNSWAVLSLSLTNSNFLNAVLMNVTGFFAFYFFERIWAKINYGRYVE
jgi:uncharacterized membrane protein